MSEEDETLEETLLMPVMLLLRLFGTVGAIFEIGPFIGPTPPPLPTLPGDVTVGVPMLFRPTLLLPLLLFRRPANCPAGVGVELKSSFGYRTAVGFTGCKGRSHRAAIIGGREQTERHAN